MNAIQANNVLHCSSAQHNRPAVFFGPTCEFSAGKDIRYVLVILLWRVTVDFFSFLIQHRSFIILDLTQVFPGLVPFQSLEYNIVILYMPGKSH